MFIRKDAEKKDENAGTPRKDRMILRKDPGEKCDRYVV